MNLRRRLRTLPAVKRNKHYRMLRRAGFNSKDANKFKDYSEQYVKKLCDLNIKFKEHMKQEMQRLGVKHD